MKPFSEIISDEVEEKETLKPFIDKPDGGKEFQERIQEEEKQEYFIKRFINFLASIQGFLTILVLFLLVAIGVDAMKTFQELFTSSSVLDGIYLSALVVLGFSLSVITYKNYQQIKTLKNVKNVQHFFALQKINPDKKIVPATLKLLATYAQTNDKTLKQKIELLTSRIKSSHDYKEIYKELDEEVLSIIDTEVQNKIKIAATQAAISTAISPLALLDGAIIIWRAVLLTKDIAKLYGFKPSWLGTIILLKHGAFNVFFATTTELATEYINDIAHSSLLSKISLSATEGLTNGILLARLGYGVMQACRPLPLKVKRASLIQSFYASSQ